jgi:hypothetical protein
LQWWNGGSRAPQLKLFYYNFDSDYGKWFSLNSKAFWRGWYTKEDGGGLILNESTHVFSSDITLYPQFYTIVFWPKYGFINKGIGEGWTGSWISAFIPGQSLWKFQQENKEKVPCFFKLKNWPVYKWQYPKDKFPLKSGDIVVMELIKIEDSWLEEA